MTDLPSGAMVSGPTDPGQMTHSETPAAGFNAGLVVELYHTTNVVRTHVERTVLLPERMRWTAFDVLALICRRQSIETRTVAAEVGIAKATLTEIVGVLVGRGLVRRQTDPTDRRRVHLQPTSTGIAFAARVQQRVRAEEVRLLGRTEPAVREQLTAMLAALADRARQLANGSRRPRSDRTPTQTANLAPGVVGGSSTTTGRATPAGTITQTDGKSC